MKKSGKDVKILNIRIDSTPKGELLAKIAKKLSSQAKTFIVTPNPEIILEARGDEKFARILNSADIAIPDGVGLGLPVIKGREFMLDLLSLADKKKLKVYLLGSTEAVNAKAKSELGQRYKNVEIRGKAGPKLSREANPVLEIDRLKQIEVVNEIKKFKPHLLFVAFGAPKQEKWLDRHLGKLPVRLGMAVGGSLDYLAGVSKLPPKFLENLGLEWLWRLILEPWRAPRIFRAVIVFPLTLFFQEKS